MSISEFSYNFVINPIYFTGGAASVSGGTVPLLAYTQGDVLTSLVGPGGDLNYDNAFAHFAPLAGSSLVNNQIGTYPFANQATAANAIITSPLNISLMMTCPCRLPGDYSRKQAILSALKVTLDDHVLAGGLFAVNTPGFLYRDLILTALRDISGSDTRQVQFRWQWDFLKPLVTLEQAQQAQNNLMSKLSNGTQVNAGDASWSNPAITVQMPASGAAPSVIPLGVSNDLGFASDLATGTGAFAIPNFSL